MTKQKNVRWKCPECGNHHSWYWSKYDVFPGEITMTCDNPECEAESKMIMTVDKKGNATAVVYKEDKELEDKLQRATEKVMNSKTEIDPSRILKDNDFIWYMGEKYQKVEKPEPKTLYGICVEWCDDDNDPPVKDLVETIVRNWLPKPIEDKSDGVTYGQQFTNAWNRGYNYYRQTLIDTLGGDDDPM